MTGRYEGSDAWHDHVAQAIEHWQVTNQLQDGHGSGRGDLMQAEFTDGWRTRLVVAQARTGSRYTVHAARLTEPEVQMLGGKVLVTMLHPWQSAYVFDDFGPLYSTYVADKMAIGRGVINGGDHAALTYTIAHVLGRKPVIG